MITEILIGTMVGGTAAAIVTFVATRKILSTSRVALVSAYDIECQAVLDLCVAEGLCDRALLLKMHNGGGKIVAGKPKYASVLFEAHNQKVSPVKDDFQRYEIDTEYANLMQGVVLKKKVVQETAKMPISMLRRRYEHDGITAAIIPFFIETEGGMYYGSFSTTQSEVQFFGDTRFARLEVMINRLRNIHDKAARQKILD